MNPLSCDQSLALRVSTVYVVDPEKREGGNGFLSLRVDRVEGVSMSKSRFDSSS